MDVDKIYDYAKSRFDHARNKQILREKYQAKLVFAYGGGMWKAGPELINILNIAKGNESIVIEDLYNNPIRVNAKEMLELSTMHWQEQMNGWLTEYEENNKER